MKCFNFSCSHHSLKSKGNCASRLGQYDRCKHFKGLGLKIFPFIIEDQEIFIFPWESFEDCVIVYPTSGCQVVTSSSSFSTLQELKSHSILLLAVVELADLLSQMRNLLLPLLSEDRNKNKISLEMFLRG